MLYYMHQMKEKKKIEKLRNFRFWDFFFFNIVLFDPWYRKLQLNVRQIAYRTG